MIIEEHVQYWQKSARHDLDSAEAMFDAGRFDWCLFVGHLSLEKMLKAIFIHRTSEISPGYNNGFQYPNPLSGLQAGFL